MMTYKNAVVKKVCKRRSYYVQLEMLFDEG